MSDVSAEEAALERLQEQGLTDSATEVVEKDESGFRPFDPAHPEDDWEEVGEDNGELVAWSPGVSMIGTYIFSQSIPLTEEQRSTSANPDKTEADMLVFEDPANEERWCTWVTYGLQKVIDKGMFVEGDLYKITCRTERKSKQGNVLIFSVKRRKAAQQRLV